MTNRSAASWIPAIPVVLIITATQVGFLQSSLLTQPLTGREWLACIGLDGVRRRRTHMALSMTFGSARAPSPIDVERAVAPARAVTLIGPSARGG